MKKPKTQKATIQAGGTQEVSLLDGGKWKNEPGMDNRITTGRCGAAGTFEVSNDVHIPKVSIFPGPRIFVIRTATVSGDLSTQAVS